MSITTAESERARTWILEIIEVLLPGTAYRDTGDERTYEHTGGLCVHRLSGSWYCHAQGRGGYSPVGLIRFIKNHTQEDAVRWVAAFLAAHPGVGAATQNTDDGEGDAAAGASRIKAEAVLAAMVPITGTVAETYLLGRGLAPPYPDCIGFLQNARVGEGALVGRLEAHDRTVGAQLTYLDPDGRKSLVEPKRRRFNLEKSSGAGFLIPSAARSPIIVCEGLEDGLSVALTGVGPVIGLPGIAALRHLELPKGAEVVVFRDGDDPDSAATKALLTGTDHLLLAGAAAVRVTATPAGQDANALLQSTGVELLRQLIADATPAELSLRGEITRLAKLDRLNYAGERKAVAKKHGISLSILDAEVKAHRNQAEAVPEADTLPSKDDPMWDGPPVVLAELLDSALKEVGRYIVASKTKLATAVLWCAHTHLVHNEFVGLQISPRLAIQAKTPSSGKTTMLEIVAELSSRGESSSSVTAAAVMRTMHELKCTHCLDEADRQLAESDNRHDLMEILNTGHRRSKAWATRCVPLPDGGWKVVKFNVWGAVAFAGIGELPPTLQDRSVVVNLQRATGAEVREHLRDGSSLELVNIRRQFCAWSDGLFGLPDPELPAILQREHGRAGDNWRPLISVSDVAGGQWPDLARQAAVEAVAAERKQTEAERLLAAIRRAFDKSSEKLTADAPDNRSRLRTKTLIGWLLDDLEDDWSTANRGRIITAAWLRNQLRGLLEPAGACDWWIGNDPRVHYSGYLRLQFTDAWRRYAPEPVVADSYFSEPAKPSGASGASGAPGANSQNSADYEADAAAPDTDVVEGIGCSSDADESQDFSQAAPDTPDAPDAPDDFRGRGNIKKSAERGTKQGPQSTTNGSAGVPPTDDAAEADAGEIEMMNMVTAAHAAHPAKSIVWLARHVGLPVDVVRSYIAAAADPTDGPG